MVSLHLGRARWIRVRIVFLVVAMAVGVAAVAHGAWDLGVTRRDELKALAKEQYRRSITLSARRGMITDRHGEELAVEVEVDSVYADPRRVESPRAAAAALAPILERDGVELLERLSSDRHFVWLRRRVSPAIAEQVRALGVPGVDLVKESKRFYPNRSLASHVVGFAGIDSKGLEGIERKFDEQLRGNRDAIAGLSDASGRVVFADGVLGRRGVVGNTLELTIDRTLQHIAEQELGAIARTFEAKAGHVVVMEPDTGEVLALANWPDYNPNAINLSTPETRRNRAVLDVFEPGSTFKVFTLAAALNSGAIRPDELLFCERGRLEMYDAVIHDDHRDGWLNPTQCLKRSSNVCFAKIALELGKKRLYHYLRRFGFGERTHAHLPFEMRGTLHHYKKWYDIDAATIAFGQGVGVTGLQMAAALGAIANGGNLMRPLLIKRIVSPEGDTVRTFSSEKRRRVISRYTSRMVADMMTAVTEEGGTGTEAGLEGFLVAGKTGTAQKSEGSKGYHSEKWIASFIGFVPADRPRLVITVFIDEPIIDHYGGKVAAPAFKRIADQSLRYLGVSPRFSKARSRRKSARESEGGEPDPGGDGEGTSGREEPDEADLYRIEPGPGEVATPDLTGATMKAAFDAISAAGLRPVFSGTGFAADQVPAAGDPVEEGGFVRVEFLPYLETADRVEGDGEDR